MVEPSNLLVKFSRRLFADSADQAQFIETLTHPRPFHPCILWCKQRHAVPFTIESPLPWQPQFVDRLSLGARPGQHPMHEAGYFYCLDFSSIFAASTLLSISQPVNLVFDICASPGGKSLFAWQALQPQLLISNEVISKRIGMLVANLKRCHPVPLVERRPRIVLSLDSSILATRLPKTTQVVMVDAPCTGQSLLAKGGKAPGCFHPVNINKNANRQKRILANSAQLVAPQGYLAYMTCAYSLEENEQVSQWLLERFPQFQPLSVQHLAAYQSHLTTLPCYRMWPQSGLGAGAFTILFKNTELGENQQLPEDFLDHPGLTFL